MSKPKVAFYWCASCGGCEEAVIDLNEAILDVVNAVDIIFWPVALDYKHDDIRKLQDNEIAVSFINGAIRTEEQEEIAKLLRQKSQLVISFGSCSHMGGIPGMANFYKKDDLLQRAYIESESTENSSGKIPKPQSKYDKYDIELPAVLPRVYALKQIMDIDYYLPGCPPTPKIINNAIQAILNNELPEKGAVLTENKALCKDCKRNETKPDKLYIKEFKRPHEIIDDGKCFLEQGVICLGVSTRTGCETSCINANMPCRGCFGPTDDVEEFGSKAASAISAMIETDDEQSIEQTINSIVDPSGLFYRYSLPVSIIQDEKKEEENK